MQYTALAADEPGRQDTAGCWPKRYIEIPTETLIFSLAVGPLSQEGKIKSVAGRIQVYRDIHRDSSHPRCWLTSGAEVTLHQDSGSTPKMLPTPSKHTMELQRPRECCLHTPHPLRLWPHCDLPLKSHSRSLGELNGISSYTHQKFGRSAQRNGQPLTSRRTS